MEETKPIFKKSDLSLCWEAKGTEANQEDFADALSPEEVPLYSQAAHKRDNEGYDLSQNALCYVVLGGISTVIGILFIFLSLKKRRNKIIGINYASLQFVICVLALALGVVLLSVGLVLLFKALKKRKAAKRDIIYLGSLSRK